MSIRWYKTPEREPDEYPWQAPWGEMLCADSLVAVWYSDDKLAPAMAAIEPLHDCFYEDGWPVVGLTHIAPADDLRRVGPEITTNSETGK